MSSQNKSKIITTIYGNKSPTNLYSSTYSNKTAPCTPNDVKSNKSTKCSIENITIQNTENNAYQAFHKSNKKIIFGSKSPKPNQSPEHHKHTNTDRKSPSKFNVTLPKQTDKKKQKIQPVLTKDDLESKNHFIPISNSNSNSPSSSNIMSFNSYSYSYSCSDSDSPNPSQILSILAEKAEQAYHEAQPVQAEEVHNTEQAHQTEQTQQTEAQAGSPRCISSLSGCDSVSDSVCDSVCDTISMLSFKEKQTNDKKINIYNTQLILINIVKSLVYNNNALICGTFNSQQLIINEYKIAFMNYMKDYEINSKTTFTDEILNDLFMDENMFPDTIKRIKLQDKIDILIKHDNFNSMINSIFAMLCNYKLFYYNKGNIKNIVDKEHELQLYSNNNDGTEIFLHTIKIISPDNAITFEVHFIVLDNEKTKTNKSYQIPLYIPPGLYKQEHLHIINNGIDNFSIQYSSSQIEYIINNLNMKITSLMPIQNDYDYNKIAKYISKITTKMNGIHTGSQAQHSYMYEFDIYNTIHTKSDFWLTNKILSNTNNTCCFKCNVNIYKHSKYVIAKCCNNNYHIECMEMNYFTKGFYTYLMCDCGSLGIDENASNSRLLLALYKII